MWGHLKDRRFHGAKFRRHAAVGSYFPDFSCPEAHLIVEIDGAVHRETTEHDALRDSRLRAMGFTILRIQAVDVHNHMESVLVRIRLALEGKNPDD